ncbi:uncharacterized protein LOC122667317 [Telopea speciosissima]|uniref:uncharacterized protein LOC122667317 n=1 Tax=Telopea speciosissima TaxID=54955 RepID=UPI001CC46427|nr:uncharacterized protein LOC122667317 [Telopea speciosissima]
MAPLLLREFVTSVFISADKSLVNLSERYKLLQILHALLVYTFFLFLRFLPFLIPSVLTPPLLSENSILKSSSVQSKSSTTTIPQTFTPNKGVGGSSIARALSQLLSLMNEIPVNSRKYEVVRSLVDKLIDENLLCKGCEFLKEVNRVALSAAFSRTLIQLEDAMSKQERRGRVSGDGGSVSGSWSGPGPFSYRVSRVLRALRSFGEGARYVFACDGGGSAEKWGVELLWLAQKMAVCGCVEEAEWRWGMASSLARLSLTAEPRLQGSLVKVSAFLFKQIKGMRKEIGDENSEAEQHRESKMKMLTTWLPLLCRGSNGVDAPVLSIREREELERELEEIIETLGQEEEKEKVLSL